MALKSNVGLGGGLVLGGGGLGVSQSQPNQSSYGFGDLMFVNDNGIPWNYQPALAHLKAKNTLFISLADYTERAFERAFEKAGIAMINKDINHSFIITCLPIQRRLWEILKNSVGPEGVRYTESSSFPMDKHNIILYSWPWSV